MIARVIANWDGKQWQDDAVPIDVVESANLLTGAYTPRRISFTMYMPGVIDMLESFGNDPQTLTFAVFVGDELYSDAAARVVFGRKSCTVTMEDRPIVDASTIPPLRDMRVTFRDFEREKAVQFQYDQYKEFTSERGKWGELGAWAFRDDMPDFSLIGQDGTVTALYNERTEGTVYPIVFGKPGRGGQPAYACKPIDAVNRYIMVAGHRTKLGTVRIYKDDGGDTLEADMRDTLHTTDDKGREITVCALRASGAGVVHYEDSGKYYASFVGTAEGLPGTGADVVEWLLGQTRGIRVDYGSFAAARAQLVGYRFDTAITEVASAWDVLTQTVLPILPIGLVATKYGVGCVVRNLDYDASRGVPQVLDGQHGSDESAQVTAIEQGASTIQIAYALSGFSGKYKRAVLAYPGSTASAAGSVGYQKIETPWVYDDSTAQRIASDLSRLRSLRGTRHSFALHASVYGSGGPFEIGIGDWLRVGPSAAMLVVAVRRVGPWLEVDALYLL